MFKVWRKRQKKKDLEKNIVPIILEVSKSEHITSSLETVTEYLNSNGLPLVGIVNNAGISFRLPVEVAPLEEVKNLFNINYFSTVELTQTFLPLIRKHKGRILFISSINGVLSLYGTGYYSSTKSAIEGLVDSLRLEMNSFGVSVSSIIPGFIKTEIEHKLKTYQDFNIPDEKYQIYKKLFWHCKIQKKKSFENAPGPEVTSEAILHALTDPYPQTRYIVGHGAGIFNAKMAVILTGIFPDRITDWILEKL